MRGAELPRREVNPTTVNEWKQKKMPNLGGAPDRGFKKIHIIKRDRGANCLYQNGGNL